MNERLSRTGERFQDRVGNEEIVSVGRIDHGVGRFCGLGDFFKIGKRSDEGLDAEAFELRSLVLRPHQAHDRVPDAGEPGGDRSADVTARSRHEDAHEFLLPFLFFACPAALKKAGIAAPDVVSLDRRGAKDPAQRQFPGGTL
jgi:hypothetical protein